MRNVVSTKSTGEAETSPNMETGGKEVLLEGSFLIGLGRREVEGKVRGKKCDFS